MLNAINSSSCLRTSQQPGSQQVATHNSCRYSYSPRTVPYAWYQCMVPYFHHTVLTNTVPYVWYQCMIPIFPLDGAHPAQYPYMVPMHGTHISNVWYSPTRYHVCGTNAWYPHFHYMVLTTHGSHMWYPAHGTHIPTIWYIPP